MADSSRKRRPAKSKRKPVRDLAINAAIREIADQHGLTLHEVAGLIYRSPQTVWSWYRAKPFAAPKAALALLCCRLRLPQHPLLKD